jgi:branched-chain amino acid transport system permease protein
MTMAPQKEFSSRDRVGEAARGIWPLLSLAVALVIVVALISMGGVVLQRVATDALIKMVMVVGLYVFVGNSGVLSFGHASFMMIAAYGSAWLDVPVRYKKILMDELPVFLGQAEFHPALAAVAAMGWAGAFAFLIGIPLMRLSGIGAAIGTFSWLVIVFVVHGNWESMTGGTSSLNGLPVYVNIWVALAAVLFVMTVAYIFQTSKIGLALRASREDEVAARAIGINIWFARLMAFVISAMLVGLGGVLQGHFLGTINVTGFYFGITFITIAMLVIGGTGSLAGAVSGVVVVSVVAELLRHVEKGIEIGETVIAAPAGLRELGLAIVMLVILLFRPAGLTGGREVPFPKMLGRLFSARS